MTFQLPLIPLSHVVILGLAPRIQPPAPSTPTPLPPRTIQPLASPALRAWVSQTARFIALRGIP